jgi:hypothetical protein
LVVGLLEDQHQAQRSGRHNLLQLLVAAVLSALQQVQWVLVLVIQTQVLARRALRLA